MFHVQNLELIEFFLKEQHFIFKLLLRNIVGYFLTQNYFKEHGNVLSLSDFFVFCMYEGKTNFND